MSQNQPSMSSSSQFKTDVPDFQPQNLLKEPIKEICKFTDVEIESISSHFPSNTVFHKFDPSISSDSASDRWVCFPVFPFQIGYSYPFPEFTSDFFVMTGLSYIQAMPMIWRTLFTNEEIICKKGLRFTVAELSHLYNLVTHGCSRFLLKSKPHQALPVLKATQNEHFWKNQFFFVRRDSIPGGKDLPVNWALKGRI